MKANPARRSSEQMLVFIIRPGHSGRTTASVKPDNDCWHETQTRINHQLQRVTFTKLTASLIQARQSQWRAPDGRGPFLQ